MDHEAIAEQLVSDIQEVKQLKGKKLSLAVVLPHVLKAVETYAMGKSLTSADKRKIAIALILKLLQNSGSIPNVDQITLMVNMAIGMSNCLFGKKWLKLAK